MKFLLASDIHIHPHKNSLQRLQHCLDALEWIFQTAIQRKIKNVLFLGDLFQDRQKIQILPYHKTYACFQKYAAQGLHVYLLVGNHDMWYADRCDITSVFPFNAIENVQIISQPSTINIEGTNFDFLPYTKNPLESISCFEKPSKVLLGHIAIDGALLNQHYHRISEISVEYEGDMTPVSSDQFSRWEKVFLGHFHGEQITDNIEYVGSPLQLNFAEAFQEKHIIIFDSETMITEYIVNDFSPKHYIIKEDEIKNYKLNNSFVKIEPNNISSADLIDLQKDILENQQALSVEISDYKDVSDERRNIDEAKNIILSKDKFHIIEKYVEIMETNLDKEVLTNIGKTFVEKGLIQ